MEKIKISIVDDHALVVNLLKKTLETDSRYEVVSTYNNGKDFLNDYQNSEIDIVILDFFMPDLNGLKILEQISNSLKVIIMSYRKEKGLVEGCFKAGAKGYVSKESEDTEIFKAIEAILEDKDYKCPIIEKRLKSKSDKELTKQEIEILELICQGWKNTEISGKLFISSNTVETHRKNIANKLDAHSPVLLVRKAIELGYALYD